MFGPIIDTIVLVVAMMIATEWLSNYFDRKNGIINNASEIRDELDHKNKE